MAKQCETFEHTADVGLIAQADCLKELFEALGEGLADFILSRETVIRKDRRYITVSAEDVESLAVDFLNRILFLIQAEHFAVAAVAVSRADATTVAAEVFGEPLDPARHDVHMEVKAITYYALKVSCQDGRWTGCVILDL